MSTSKEEIGILLEPFVSLEPGKVVDLLETPPDPAMGDLAFPCYLLASRYKEAPTQIAERLSRELAGKRGFFWEKAVAKGPYLNFYLDPVAFGRAVLNQVLGGGTRYGWSDQGRGKTVVIDYSSPNIAKPFGIGHIRSTVLGHSLYLIYQALGYRCIGINHLGDWGTQFGKLIVAFKRWGDEAQLQADPVNYLFQLYVKFHQFAENDSALEDEARLWFKELELGNREAVSYWTRFRTLSLDNYAGIYDLLGIKFEYFHGESHYNNRLDGVIRLVREKGIAVESEGALIIDLEKYSLPPVMLQKKDGATLYITRDLAAAIYRYETFGFSKALYVVGAEQILHFQQLFKILELLGFPWSANCLHVPFGLIRFKEGRMSTREGNIIFLEEVLQRSIQLARETIEGKNPGLRDKDSVAKVVGLGAVRFGDLSNDRIKDIEFDWDKVLDFSGETAVYIQYAHARICSILRKAGGIDPGWTVDTAAGLLREEEKTLLKTLAELPEKIALAAEGCRPSIIARHLIDVAREFNRFYHNCPVLNSDPALQQSRLLLIEAVRLALVNGLGLLGIEAPAEM
ncbi:MAG: arginine--tRNA ligase [Bacillota bacterium]